MPSTKPAASIVVVAVSVLVQYLLHSWNCSSAISVIHTHCWYHWRPPFSDNNTSSTTSPLLSDTYNLFPPFIGQLLTMEVVLALLISLLGDGGPYMKISMILKNRVRPLPVLPKDPNSLSMQKQCSRNVLWHVGSLPYLCCAILWSDGAIYGRCTIDFIFNKMHHIYCKHPIKPTSVILMSMWLEEACLNDCALSWANHMDI